MATLGTLQEKLDRYDADHAWLRQMTIPEEDRPRLTSAKWSGEFRWFRSGNVIPLEVARLLLRRT
jgi:hypothetical protein